MYISQYFSVVAKITKGESGYSSTFEIIKKEVRDVLVGHLGNGHPVVGPKLRDREWFKPLSGRRIFFEEGTFPTLLFSIQEYKWVGYRRGQSDFECDKATSAVMAA